jgi:hypothetical protein
MQLRRAVAFSSACFNRCAARSAGGVAASALSTDADAAALCSRFCAARRCSAFVARGGGASSDGPSGLAGSAQRN